VILNANEFFVEEVISNVISSENENDVFHEKDTNVVRCVCNNHDEQEQLEFCFEPHLAERASTLPQFPTHNDFAF
jgi:hypothetical protein